MLSRSPKPVAAAKICLFLLISPLGSTGAYAAIIQSYSDSTSVTILLEGARGANVVMCELALHSVDGRWGNWGFTRRAPDATTGVVDLVDWSSRELRSGEVVRILADALSDRDACVPRLAARLFGYVENPDAIEVLVDRLRDGDGGTRQMAALGLGYLDSTGAVVPLIRALDDGEATVRAAATWALGVIEDERAIDPLTRLLREDEDPVVRRQAAWALGSMF